MYKYNALYMLCTCTLCNILLCIHMNSGTKIEVVEAAQSVKDLKYIKLYIRDYSLIQEHC